MSLQKFKTFVSNSGLKFDIKEFSDSRCCKTAADAAKVAQCEVGQIANSLIFKSIPSSHPVLIITSGSHRVDEKFIGSSHFLGTKLQGESGITRADAKFVRDATGYPVGGIPPFGHDTEICTFIDETLSLDTRNLWAAAGTPNAIFSITSNELKEITNGKVIKVD